MCQTQSGKWQMGCFRFKQDGFRTPLICQQAHFANKCLYRGGEGGIRTPGTRKRSTVFKTAAFNHSATSPQGGHQPERHQTQAFIASLGASIFLRHAHVGHAHVAQALPQRVSPSKTRRTFLISPCWLKYFSTWSWISRSSSENCIVMEFVMDFVI